MSDFKINIRCEKCGRQRSVVLPSRPGLYGVRCANEECRAITRVKISDQQAASGTTRVVTCPKCSSKVSIPQGFSGSQVRCPICHTAIPTGAPKAPAAAQQQPKPTPKFQPAPMSSPAPAEKADEQPDEIQAQLDPEPMHQPSGGNGVPAGKSPNSHGGIKVGIERITIEELKRRQAKKRAASNLAPAPEPAPAPAPQPTPPPPPPAPAPVFRQSQGEPAPKVQQPKVGDMDIDRTDPPFALKSDFEQPSAPAAPHNLAPGASEAPRTQMIDPANIPGKPAAAPGALGARCALEIRKMFGLSVKTFELRQDVTLVGRPDPNLRSHININDQTVSRQSIEIARINQGAGRFIWRLKVRKCANPVLVNNRQLAVGQEVHLKYGDEITLGNTTLTFVKMK